MLLGLGLIIGGDLQSMVAGAGAIVAAAVLFGFLAWSSGSAGMDASQADAGESSEMDRPTRLIWLGIGLSLAPGLLYFYLRFTMSRFDPVVMLFAGVPLLFAGFGCAAIGLRSLVKAKGHADCKADVGDAHEPHIGTDTPDDRPRE